MDILTFEGFVKTYFELLPNCHTQLEAFDTVSNTVYSITKTYPFYSLQDFKIHLYTTGK